MAIALKKFFKLIKNNSLTELHDYETEYQDGHSSYIKNNDQFYEINTSWYLKKHKPKFFYSFNHFMKFMFKDYKNLKYLRFSPGGAYVIPKKNILVYEKFYENIRFFLSWDVVIGEAHILERALYYIFSNSYEAKIDISKMMIRVNIFNTMCIYWLIYKPIDMLKKCYERVKR